MFFIKLKPPRFKDFAVLVFTEVELFDILYTVRYVYNKCNEINVKIWVYVIFFKSKKSLRKFVGVQ